jgi:hypothetical protein
MSDQTTNLSLPYILPSQAQKHVTHNEALQVLDAVVQLVVTAETAAPPDAPSEGECYLVSALPTDAWSGKGGSIAFRQDGAWIFIAPKEGWRAWFSADAKLRVLTGGAWTDLTLPSSGTMPTLGINATADETNRLAVASAASLFNHVGNGHQMKVNKAAASDTASLLFQTNWSGRAEMGLAGNDAFSIKVSPDGNSWQTGLSVSPQGIVTMPGRPLVRASLAAASALSPAAGSQTGFGNLSVAQGGFVLGAALGSGPGNRLTVPATGLYLLILNVSTTSSSGHAVSILSNGETQLATVASPAQTGAQRQSATGLTLLNAGDQITLLHAGTALIEFGNNKTEVIMLLL